MVAGVSSSNNGHALFFLDSANVASYFESIGGWCVVVVCCCCCCWLLLLLLLFVVVVVRFECLGGLTVIPSLSLRPSSFLQLSSSASCPTDADGVREVSLRAGQVVIGQHGLSDTGVLLPLMEDAMFDENWRIRKDVCHMLGECVIPSSFLSLEYDYVPYCISVMC